MRRKSKEERKQQQLSESKTFRAPLQLWFGFYRLVEKSQTSSKPIYTPNYRLAKNVAIYLFILFSGMLLQGKQSLTNNVCLPIFIKTIRVIVVVAAAAASLLKLNQTEQIHVRELFRPLCVHA